MHELTAAIGQDALPGLRLQRAHRPLPDRALLADLCREAAAREGVEPQLVEKDFYLTRLLWALGQHFGDALLLKGGTLLSKVDLGLFRMSEDADLVLPGTPSRRNSQNVARMHAVRKALADVLAPVAMTARFPRRAWHVTTTWLELGGVSGGQ